MREQGSQRSSSFVNEMKLFDERLFRAEFLAAPTKAGVKPL